MWRRCVAGAWRLKSPVEDKTCFPSATLVDLGMPRVKGELHADYKLLLFERALKMLNNDVYINKICKAVLEISKL